MGRKWFPAGGWLRRLQRASRPEADESISPGNADLRHGDDPSPLRSVVSVVAVLVVVTVIGYLVFGGLGR